MSGTLQKKNFLGQEPVIPLLFAYRSHFLYLFFRLSAIIICCLCITTTCLAQDFSLIHSGTSYDAFENPVQQSFIQEKSKKYSLNILPSISADFAFSGDAEASFKNLIFGEAIRTSNLSSDRHNLLDADFNLYLIQFRIYKDWEYHKEMGFSLQVRNQTQGDVPNSTIAFLNNYQNFNGGNYSSVFNGVARNQLFYQLGFSYRENYNKKWAFGGKISFLAGVLNTDMEVERSSLEVFDDRVSARFSGRYNSSFGTQDLEGRTFIPSLKNPGASLSLGTSYTTKNRFYFSLNLKDLGFIHWGDSLSRYRLQNTEVVVSTFERNSIQSDFSSNFGRAIKESQESGSGTSKLSPQLTFAVSKYYGPYHLVFVLDQFVLNRQQSRIALLNNYNYRRISFGLNGFYHLDHGFNLGTHFMVKSENTEFYIGTEKLISSYALGKSFVKDDPSIAENSPIAANIYLGLNIKFGRVVNSPPQADFIDGLNDEETGYIYRLNNKEKRSIRRRSPKK